MFSLSLFKIMLDNIKDIRVKALVEAFTKFGGEATKNIFYPTELLISYSNYQTIPSIDDGVNLWEAFSIDTKYQLKHEISKTNKYEPFKVNIIILYHDGKVRFILDKKPKHKNHIQRVLPFYTSVTPEEAGKEINKKLKIYANKVVKRAIKDGDIVKTNNTGQHSKTNLGYTHIIYDDYFNEIDRDTLSALPKDKKELNPKLKMYCINQRIKPLN
jgi:hypothetical protein